MCRIFSVSRSGLYSWLRRGRSQRYQINEELVNHIRRIYDETHRIYGSPRITDALRQKGIRCNKKRVARLMRINGIMAKTKRKFKVTTHSNHKRPVADNLIKGDFRAPLTDTIWTSDITFIWTQQGWLYLAVFLDVCSRRIVGWSMKSRMTDQLVIDAFRKAFFRRRPQPGLIAHSDRGSQYCSGFFKELLKKSGYLQSMSSRGNCYDNAITESFFGTLKTELVYHENYETREDAQRSIFKYIEIFYNRKRIHSALGGVSPEQFEERKRLA
jgi:putative transposase